MFVCNVKLNKKKVLKLFIALFAIICISLLCLSAYKILKEIKNDEANIFINDEITPDGVAKISVKNYTNILKAVHENIDTYVGQKISFSGYVYRVSDLKENEFVLARDMKINENETVIVGFLCYSEKAKDFETYTWVDIEGTIEKSTYRNENIPRLNIDKMEKVMAPEDKIVNLPDDYFVPTAVIY